MTLKEIKAIVARIPTWSEEQQLVALDVLKWIEAKDIEDDGELSAEDWALLSKAEEFLTEEELEAFLATIRASR